MSLNKFYDFMKILYGAGNLPIKNQYFSKHILFSTIYLLQAQNLNLTNYSKQEAITNIFAWTTDHDMSMQAKIQSMNRYRYL
jgi:hypothetical protein